MVVIKNVYCGENFGNIYLIFLRADMKCFHIFGNFDTKRGYLRDYPFYFKNKKVNELLCTINYEFHLKITSCLINYVSDRLIGLCSKLWIIDICSFFNFKELWVLWIWEVTNFTFKRVITLKTIFLIFKFNSCIFYLLYKIVDCNWRKMFF